MLKKLASMGWSGWVMVLRRTAPWVLLVVALFQLKTLTDKVKQVEDREFRQVQDEVAGLRNELVHLREDAQKADADLNHSRETLETLNTALDKARRHAPELVRTLAEAKASSDALREAMPSPDAAAALTQSLKTADGQVGGVLAGLPSAEASAKLAEKVQNANRTVTELQSKLPDAAEAVAVQAALDADQKRLVALTAALPKPEAAAALAKQLEAAHEDAPTEEQVKSLGRELAKAHAALQSVAAAGDSHFAVTPSPPNP